MTRITKTIDVKEDQLLITVDYDPATEAVEIISMKARNRNEYRGFDLTNLFCEPFLSGFFDDMVDKINWQDVYLEYKEAKETFYRMPSKTIGQTFLNKSI